MVATVFFHPSSTVLAFLLASAVTLEADISEVITVLLVLREMHFQRSMPASEVAITQGILLAACRSPETLELAFPCPPKLVEVVASQKFVCNILHTGLLWRR